jgi:hypothetical protein
MRTNTNAPTRVRTRTRTRKTQHFLNGVKHSVTSLIAEEYGKRDGEINTIRDTITKPDERESRITRTREQREKGLEGA